MHQFGARCFAYVQQKQKLDPRAEEGIFIGYDPYSPALMLYFPEKQDIRRIRCVKFIDEEINQDHDDEIIIRMSTHNSTIYIENFMKIKLLIII